MMPLFCLEYHLSCSSCCEIIIGITSRSLTYNSVEDILQVLIVFAIESLELDFALLFPERHIILRVLPVLVVLATSSEKDSESLYKRVKINRLINIFKVFCSYLFVLW
jgi:cytoplasmic FMR1 interacting protein